MKVSLALVPISELQQWLVAASVAGGLFVYAHGVAWVWASALGRFGRKWSGLVGMRVLVAVAVLLPGWALLWLAQFRGEGLEAQAGPALTDPRFFLPLQIVLMIGALIASVRWFVSADERRLNARAKERAGRSAAQLELARQQLQTADGELRRRLGHEQDRVTAIARLAHAERDAADADAVAAEQAACVLALSGAEFRLGVAERERDEARREQAEATAAAERDAAEAHAAAASEHGLARLELELQGERDAAERKAAALRERHERKAARRRERFEREDQVAAAKAERRGRRLRTVLDFLSARRTARRARRDHRWEMRHEWKRHKWEVRRRAKSVPPAAAVRTTVAADLTAEPRVNGRPLNGHDHGPRSVR